MKRRRIQLSYPKKLTPVKSNPLSRVKRLRFSKDVFQKPNKIFFIFLCSIIFLLVTIFLYEFQFLLPRFQTDSSELVRPNGSVLTLSHFNKALKDKNIQFETIKTATESPTVIVYLEDGGYAYLDLNTDPTSQVNLLSLILSRMTVENPNKRVKFVDLRPEKAVVKF